MEEVKLELNSYIQDKKLLEENEQELEELITKATKATADLSLSKSGGSSTKDKMAEYAAQIVDIQNKKYEKLIEMYKKKEMIEKKIDVIEQPYKNILYYKYIKGYNLIKIADILNYNYEHICRLHGHALKKYKDVK